MFYNILFKNRIKNYAKTNPFALEKFLVFFIFQ